MKNSQSTLFKTLGLGIFLSFSQNVTLASTVKNKTGIVIDLGVEAVNENQVRFPEINLVSNPDRFQELIDLAGKERVKKLISNILSENSKGDAQ
jgi:hypothetical protein